MPKRYEEDDHTPESCSCWRSAPCSYCMSTAECQGCGALFFEEDVYRSRREHEEFPVCAACAAKYQQILERHGLDCRCGACEAFASGEDAESGFKAALPLLILKESEGGHLG